MTNEELAGKTYIITGGSRGIGLATARALGRRGARVALLGRDAALLGQNAAEIGNQSFPVAVDVADRAALMAAIDKAALALGGLDGIINNAGVALAGAIETLKHEEVAAQVDVNFLAQVYGCQAAIPHLRRRGGGRIVNVSSVSVRRHDEFAYISIYSATKAAIERFTLDLREEVKGDNISVTLFCPGSTATAFGAGGDPVVIEKAFREWMGRAPTYDGRMEAETVGETLASCLTLPLGAAIDFLEVSPNKPVSRSNTLDDYANRVDNP
jgi:NAD(P)-dependent dehydrogenase (short-subunit alcohol dehydrogenase family)